MDTQKQIPPIQSAQPQIPQASPGRPRWLNLALAGLVITLPSLITYLILTKDPSPPETNATESLRNDSNLPTEQPKPTPTPTPIVLTPDEGVKGNYNISQGSATKGPRITQVTFDPLDVQKGQTLTISVKLSSPSPILKVEGQLKQDNSISPITFSNIYPSQSDNALWTGSLTMNDSVLYNYILKITATNAEGISEAVVAPRSSQ